MDDAWLESERENFSSQREKRWSMNSQRLEEIVAELMKPISSDARRSFDTDLSALLEEYLTEAGLHALDAADADDAADAVAPNFAEIALLLQQSANIYGRKVDFLYNHVLAVSDSLGSAQEAANASTEEPQTPTTASRRRRRASLGGAPGAGDFAEIALEACAGCARDADVSAPPTLARAYLELEPRAAAPGDVPLFDYAAEDIGFLSDFQVTWRLQDGLLVDELEGGAPSSARSLRPISLMELQAAIEAAEERCPPHTAWSPAGASSPAPLAASTPLPGAGPEPEPGPEPAAPEPPDPAPPEPLLPPPSAPVVKKERKRASDTHLQEAFDGSVKILFDKDLMKKLKEKREFSIDKRWISKVVQQRKGHILSERRRLGDELHDELDETQLSDKGFPGWSAAEARSALLSARRVEDSDDGFFEQSSGADERCEPPAEPGAPHDLAAWRSSILQRASASEARGTFDVHALGSRVLQDLRGAERPLHVDELLDETALRGAEVSHVFLATLFLANAGNVEIEQGPPLSLNSFSLKLLSSDESRFRLAAQADAAAGAWGAAGAGAAPALPPALADIQRRPRARPKR